MGSQPSPGEAAEALREVAEHRRKEASTDANPKWLLGVFGVLVVGVGVGTDLRPELGTSLLYALVAIALLLTFLPRRKSLGSAMGYRRDPRPVGMSARARVLRGVAMLALMALVAGAGMMIRGWDVAYPATVGSVLILLTMPLWRGFLNFAGREPKAAYHG